MKTAILKTSLALACAAILVAKGQNSTPIVIQAMPAATSSAAAPKLAASDSNGSVQTAVKTLEQVRVANQETLKKQQALLEQLDDLAKAAEQIKVFTKRG